MLLFMTSVQISESYLVSGIVFIIIRLSFLNCGRLLIQEIQCTSREIYSEDADDGTRTRNPTPRL